MIQLKERKVKVWLLGTVVEQPEWQDWDNWSPGIYREGYPSTGAQTALSFLFPAHGMIPPKLRADLPTAVNPV